MEILWVTPFEEWAKSIGVETSPFVRNFDEPFKIKAKPFTVAVKEDFPKRDKMAVVLNLPDSYVILSDYLTPKEFISFLKSKSVMNKRGIIDKINKYMAIYTNRNIAKRDVATSKPSSSNNKKGSRAVYNAVFELFKRKAGYMSDLNKTAAGTKVAELSFDNLSDVEDAIKYFKKERIKYSVSSINKKRVVFYP